MNETAVALLEESFFNASACFIGPFYLAAQLHVKISMAERNFIGRRDGKVQAINTERKAGQQEDVFGDVADGELQPTNTITGHSSISGPLAARR